MSNRAFKSAPMGLVAGALAYLCWPYFDNPVELAPPKGLSKASELDPHLLSPPPAPRLDRDPFLTGKAQARDSKRRATDEPSAELTQTNLDEKREVPVELEGLVLNGTYVRGDRRIAMINGRPFSQGQQVILSQGEGPKCQIERIQAHKVFVAVEGKLTELSYANARPPGVKMAVARDTSPRQRTSGEEQHVVEPGSQPSAEPPAAPPRPPAGQRQGDL